MRNRGLFAGGGGILRFRILPEITWEHGGRRLVELADRLGRTEGAVRQRASRLRALQLEGDARDGLGPSLGAWPTRSARTFAQVRPS